MPHLEPPSPPSRATPEGNLIAGAAGLSGQQGWRRTGGRTIAFVVLGGGAVAVLGTVVGIVRVLIA